MISGKPSYFDLVVFVVWVGICLAPIFQEMSFLGFKFKQQIEELKKDINHQLSIMKTEIRSSIEVSNANQNHISVNASPEPARDSEIPQLEEAINKILKSKGIDQADYQLPEASPIVIEMFKVRLSFEHLVNRYTSENTPVIATDISRRRGYSLGRTLSELRKSSYLSQDVLAGVSEIISICNYAIHNEKVSDKQVEFVRKSASNLYRALEGELSENRL